MGVTFADIHDLRSGWRDPIIVGELPYYIHLRLNLRVPQVHLSGESLAHIARRHPDIGDDQLLFITPTIEKGMVMQQNNKPQMLVAVYQDPMSHHRYAATMKVASRGSEVWLQSFHRAGARETRRWLNRSRLLFKHAKQ